MTVCVSPQGHQLGGLNRQKLSARCCLAALEAGSSRSEGQRGALLPEVLRDSLFHAPGPPFLWFLAILGEPRLVGTPCQALPPWSHGPQSLALGPAAIHYDLTLADYIREEPAGRLLKCQGLWPRKGWCWPTQSWGLCLRPSSLPPWAGEPPLQSAVGVPAAQSPRCGGGGGRGGAR